MPEPLTTAATQPPQGEALLRRWTRRLGPAGPLALGAILLPIIGGIALLGIVQDLAPWLQSQGAIGPVIAALAFAILAGPCLIPTYAVYIVCGWCFGLLIGLPTAVAALTGAGVIGYGISRTSVGDHVVQGLRHRPRWDAVRLALLASSTKRSILIVALLRLAPLAPFGITNLFLASVHCPAGAFTIGTFIGTIPRAAIVVFAAAGLEELNFDRNRGTVIAGIAMAIIALVLLGLIGRHALAKITAEQPSAE